MIIRLGIDSQRPSGAESLLEGLIYARLQREGAVPRRSEVHEVPADDSANRRPKGGEDNANAQAGPRRDRAGWTRAFRQISTALA